MLTSIANSNAFHPSKNTYRPNSPILLLHFGFPTTSFTISWSISWKKSSEIVDISTQVSITCFKKSLTRLSFGDKVGEIGEVCEVGDEVKVGEVRLGVDVDGVRDDDKVGEVKEDDTVGEVILESKVGEVKEDDTVGEVSDDSKVGEVKEDDTVGEVIVESKVGEVKEDDTVGEVIVESIVGEVKEDDTVGEVSDEVTVGEVSKVDEVGEDNVVVRFDFEDEQTGFLPRHWYQSRDLRSRIPGSAGMPIQWKKLFRAGSVGFTTFCWEALWSDSSLDT